MCEAYPASSTRRLPPKRSGSAKLNDIAPIVRPSLRNGNTAQDWAVPTNAPATSGNSRVISSGEWRYSGCELTITRLGGVGRSIDVMRIRSMNSSGYPTLPTILRRPASLGSMRAMLTPFAPSARGPNEVTTRTTSAVLAALASGARASSTASARRPAPCARSRCRARSYEAAKRSLMVAK
jgi:hypothetical protein